MKSRDEGKSDGAGVIPPSRGEQMRRAVSLILVAALGLPASVQAQYERFQLTPFVGYMFGGAYEFDGGRFEAQSGLGWGATASFAMGRGAFVDLTYIRQDTKVDLEGSGAIPDIADAAELDLNYFHIGGHREFGQPGGKVLPYFGGALGAVLYSPNVESIDTDDNWEFSFGLNAGIKYFMGQSQRVALRFDMRGLWFWVPSDDYGYWCDFYGCFVVQGTETVAQGLASAGLVVKF
jgi:Outer membrane protein beta-barrel domain